MTYEQFLDSHILSQIAIVCIAAWMITYVYSQAIKQRNGGQHGKIRARFAFFLPKALWAIAIIYCLHLFGVEPNSLIGILSAAGIAIGLIVTPVGSNAVAGAINIWNDTYRIGETIEVDGYLGEVKRTGMMSTTVASPDGILIDIPNKLLLEHIVNNFTRIPFYRFVSKVYIDDADATDDDILGYIQNALKLGAWNVEYERKGEMVYQDAFAVIAEEEPDSRVFEVYGFTKYRLDEITAKAGMDLAIRRELDAHGIKRTRTSNLSTTNGPLQIEISNLSEVLNA